jgi:hypothetical protein
MYYQITYPTYNQTQVKKLISRGEYEYYKTLTTQKHECEVILKDKKTKPEITLATKNLLQQIHVDLQPFKEQFFVEDGPLGEALLTGLLVLPVTQGDTHPVKFQPLDQYTNTVEE